MEYQLSVTKSPMSDRCFMENITYLKADIRICKFNVDLKPALIIAVALFIGGWCGTDIANPISDEYLRLAFCLFIVLLGLYLIDEVVCRLSLGVIARSSLIWVGDIVHQLKFNADRFT